MIKRRANITINITAFVRIFSARGIFFCPKLTEKFTLPPIPTINPSASCEIMLGKLTVIAANPNAPIPFPTNIRSIRL